MEFAMLFPGQGSQYIGMCKDIMSRNTEVKRIFEEASEVLKYDLWEQVQTTKMSVLTLSENAQPAVVTASYAFYQTFVKEMGQIPKSMVGHSLGEVSALVCSQCISFADAIAFVKERGKLMYRAMTDKKGFAGLVLDVEQKKVEDILKEVRKEKYAAISGYNSPRQFIVAGEKEAEPILEAKIDELGEDYVPFRMIPMKADVPYHSKVMSYLKDEFQEIVDKLTFHEPQISVWSTVTGKVITSKEQVSNILVNQLIRPIQWTQVLEKLSQENIGLFVDIGPNNTTRNLIRENAKLPLILSYDVEEREKIIEMLMEKRQSSIGKGI